MILPGFPLEVGGTTKCPAGSVRPTGDPETAAHRAVVRLAQKAEVAIRGRLKQDSVSPEDIAAAVKEVFRSPEIRPYIEHVHSARLVAGIIEVEFSAAGYPDRYVSCVSVEATGGWYKLRTISEPVPVKSSRCQWVRSPEETVCVAEAMDEQAHVIARAKVSLEHQEQEGLVAYHGEDGINAVEEAAMKMVRTLILQQAC